MNIKTIFTAIAITFAVSPALAVEAHFDAHLSAIDGTSLVNIITDDNDMHTVPHGHPGAEVALGSDRDTSAEVAAISEAPIKSFSDIFGHEHADTDPGTFFASMLDVCVAGDERHPMFDCS